MEVFEKQWKDLKFVDYEILNKVVRSPWSLVPVFEEKYRNNLPVFLKPHENEYQELKNAVQQFLRLRYMLYHLKFHSLDINTDKINEFPFVHEHRDVYDWSEGDTIDVEMDKTLVLCNLQLGNNLEIRYVVLDPEFFIMIEPGFEDVHLKTIQKIS